MHILHVVGARPNFMKVAPVVRSFRGRAGVNQTLGNTMIDTLVALLPKALGRWPVKPVPLASGAGEADAGLRLQQAIAGRFGLVTLHRPSNVDDVVTIDSILTTLAKISRDIPIIFPVHPRTQTRLRESGWPEREPGLVLVGPLGYLDFLALQRHATLVITDSGGVQEETTYLGLPCLTLRNNTERPVTTSAGTNTLVGHDMEQLEREVERILAGDANQGMRHRTGTVRPRSASPTSSSTGGPDDSIQAGSQRRLLLKFFGESLGTPPTSRGCSQHDQLQGVTWSSR